MLWWRETSFVVLTKLKIQNTFITMSSNYLFKSERLGFRNWLQADLPLLAEINADPDVMVFFRASIIWHKPNH
jgi:hypothetical protein